MQHRSSLVRGFRSSFACLALAQCSSLALAEIDYHVTVKQAEKQIAVEMKVPAKAGAVSVQIPKWMPGSYAYNNAYQNIHEVTASDASGKSLTVTHPDDSTWSVNAADGTVTFSYWMPFGGQRRFGGPEDSSFVQLAGPATYMYVVDRKTEPCKVSFTLPTGWPMYTGLDAARGAENTYVAPTYDVLADNPVSTGDVIMEKYNLRGIDHYIVLEGAAKDQVNKEKLLTDCRFVSAAETDFFGGAPYRKYVWHFIVFPAPDGAGGLEHLSSTQISLSSGEGPRAQSVLAHEFFHLWNVKRTRSKVLGPFDYQTLPKTGALWWLEGVTDYYATLLPYRYGEWQQPALFDGIVRNINAIANNPARLEISPYMASYRVAEANNGRGNSNGYQISYYNLGWLCGLCLDLEIRDQTNGKHSLDDVTRALFDMCKGNKPGFDEGEIRKQCIRFGGPGLGPFYDRVVMSPGELPIAEELKKFGLILQVKDEPFADAGFAAGGGGPGGRGQGPRVVNVHGPAEGKLQNGDVIKSINGQSLDGVAGNQVAGMIRGVIDGAKVGTPITLVVTRGEDTVNVSIDPAMSTRKVRSIEPDMQAAPHAGELRDGWLRTKVPAVQ